MTRAMNYAHRRGVTQVVSLGNNHEDVGAPKNDTASPNFPAGVAHERVIDNGSCLMMPVEGPHAIDVGAYGPSGAKADYSNYGVEHVSVSAPGGYFRDFYGTSSYRANENMILSTYPRNVGVAEGTIDDTTGEITGDGKRSGVQKACAADVCGYYQYLQGTSMAAPHATGVAALIVSQYGRYTGDTVTMNPDMVRRVIENTAFPLACPTPHTTTYHNEGRDDTYTATCTGTPDFNDFYGSGAVDAWSAVTNGYKYLN
jgi:subtilisin family serine protease